VTPTPIPPDEPCEPCHYYPGDPAPPDEPCYYRPGAPGAPDRPDIPQTNDPATIGLWIALTVFSLIGLTSSVAIGVRAKKRYSPKYAID